MSSDACLDVSFWRDVSNVRAALGDESIEEVEVREWTAGGGLSGDARVLALRRGGEEQELFMKFTAEGGEARSKAVGLAREGLFLGSLSKLLPSMERYAPRVYFGHGSLELGRKVIVLEMVDGVQAGKFFGPHSLHNWGQDLAKATAGFPDLDERRVALMAADVAAAMHAPYWRSKELLTSPDLALLRCREWADDGGEDSWRAALEMAAAPWRRVREAAPEGVTLDPLLVAVMDASFAKTTFEAFAAEWRALPLTLVHGDFHPANMLVRRGGDGEPQLLLVDWEVVGVGSGPQDLGQFVISHCTAEARARYAPDMLRRYAASMAKLGVPVEEEEVRREYVRGGLGRWVWLLALLLAMELPPAAAQFFHDQVLDFIKENGVTPEDAPFVRP